VAIRFELIAEAAEDLARYVRTGNLPLFLKQLIRLEEVGREAGVPLDRGLVGWRKIVVGDRDWRIIFTVDPGEMVATVWVIGDRADAECYDLAQRRLEAWGRDRPAAASLAAVMFRLSQAQSRKKMP